MKECDYLLIVPLREEFRILTKYIPIKSHEEIESIYYYELDVPELTVFAVMMGDMGVSKTSQVTTKVLNYVVPKAIILVGIAGSLTRDLLIGDVVISSEVSEFLADSKVIQEEGSWSIRFSGNHWPTSHYFKELLTNFEFIESSLYQNWLDEVSSLLPELEIQPEGNDFIREKPRYIVGHIASGNMVVSSEAFVDELKKIDRKFLAIEMEAAGVAHATVNRETQIGFFVIRGISDFADSRKSELDIVGEGSYRVYAMSSVSVLLKQLFESEGFKAIQQSPEIVTTIDISEIKVIKRDILRERPISGLLSDSLAIARTFGEEEDVEWIINELYGYRNLAERVKTKDLPGDPSYRGINAEGTLKIITVYGEDYKQFNYPYFATQSAKILEMYSTSGKDILITMNTPDDLRAIAEKQGLPVDDRLPLRVSNLKLRTLMDEIRLKLHEILDRIEKR